MKMKYFVWVLAVMAFVVCAAAYTNAHPSKRKASKISSVNSFRPFPPVSVVVSNTAAAQR